MKLEICVFNITDVVIAREGGADRIELCASYIEGGITPSHALISETFKILDPLDVVVMIRPRGGDFVYDNYELNVMKSDIEICKQLGAKNVIFGITQPDGMLDIKQNSELIEKAWPMHCTLQRAFDLTPDPYEALDQAIQCGFKRILTSGQKASAIEGKNLIRSLIETGGKRIDILPGAGINSKNAEELIRYTGCREIHTSAKMLVTQNSGLRKGIYDFSHLTQVNKEEVRSLKEIILKFFA